MEFPSEGFGTFTRFWIICRIIYNPLLESFDSSMIIWRGFFASSTNNLIIGQMATRNPPDGIIEQMIENPRPNLDDRKTRRVMGLRWKSGKKEWSMTPAEKGRLGGLKTFKKYGREYYSALGRKGAEVFHSRYELLKYGIGDWLVVRRSDGQAVARISGLPLEAI